MTTHERQPRTLTWLVLVLTFSCCVGFARELGMLRETTYLALMFLAFLGVATAILHAAHRCEATRTHRRVAWPMLSFAPIAMIALGAGTEDIGFGPLRRIATIGCLFSPFFILLFYLRSYDEMKLQLEKQVSERTTELTDANNRLRQESYEKISIANQLEVAKSDLDGTMADMRRGLKRVDPQLLHRERLEALSQVSAGISHELNNKLSPIVWYGTMLSEDPTIGEDQRDRVTSMTAAAQSAISVVRNLQQFDHRGIGATFAQVSPASLIRSAADHVRPWLASLHVDSNDFRIETRVESKKMVLADCQQLRHLLCNLVANALESVANQDQGSIQISSRDEPGWVVFEVSDNGRGMSEEESKRCFEPFFTTKAKKNGLGLSACYGIAKRHGGSLTNKPNEAGGMTFTAYIPSVDDAPVEADSTLDAQPTAATLQQDQRGDEDSIKGARILFVDDNEKVRDAVADLLAILGAEVVCIDNGNQALELLKTEDPFDLVMTDLIMEGMSGIDFLVACREFSDVPVVLISGWPRRRVIEMLEGKPQPDAVLNKPCKVTDLKKLLKQIVSKKQPATVAHQTQQRGCTV